MGAKRIKSIFHGSAKTKTRVYHRSHRSKRGESKMRRDGLGTDYRKRKERLHLMDLEKDIID